MRLLEQQVRNGNTHFLDASMLADTSAAVLVLRIFESRRTELEQVLGSGLTTPETLASTYYGHLYFSSHIRQNVGSKAGLTAFLAETGVPTSTLQAITDTPLDTTKVRFNNTSEKSATLLRAILNLTDWNSSKRVEAATELGAIRDVRAERFLCAATRDQYSWVRKSAVGALGELGQSCSVEPLICALRDVDSTVREAARESLTQIGPPAVPGLIDVVREHNEVSRQEAIRLLESSHPRMLDSMAAAIAQLSDEARLLAAQALGSIGDARAVPCLQEALHCDDVGLRDAASAALHKIHEHTSMA
jgi:HEAT repeat protein